MPREDLVWNVHHHSEEYVRALMAATGLSRPAALVLADRGITPENAEMFLNPRLAELVDPFLLPGAETAAARLWKAIRKNEPILIHGDYDTDGVTAALVLSHVLRENGAQVDIFLPHRIDDGYGLTLESLEKARREHHALLVTVDCGVTSREAVLHARSMGLDVIITDHHEPDGSPPDATAVIDPRLPGAPEELHELAGVGVAFKVCHAFLKYARRSGFAHAGTDLRDVLDLVALGTVADIVPLRHENRRLVRHGLRVLALQHRPGIRALCELAGVSDAPAPEDITFRLAPRLNAAGRLGAAADALALLAAGDLLQARNLAVRLDERNRERQSIEEKVYTAAEEKIAAEIDVDATHSIVVWSNDWHQGVIGIVASRIARRYNRPTIILTREAGGGYSGSGRSVPGLNIIEVLNLCTDFLTRYGGHTMAAGVALPEEHLEPFRAAFEQAVVQTAGGELPQAVLDIVAETPLRELLNGFFDERTLLEPFGAGNPEPVFAAEPVMPYQVRRIGERHTRGSIEDMTGARLPFVLFGLPPEVLPPPPWRIAFVPELNHYRGAVTPQLRILDVKSA